MTNRPWKVLEIEGAFPEDGRYNRWAMVIGPDGAVIIHRMNKPDAYHLVMCVNKCENVDIEKLKDPRYKLIWLDTVPQEVEPFVIDVEDYD